MDDQLNLNCVIYADAERDDLLQELEALVGARRSASDALYVDGTAIALVRNLDANAGDRAGFPDGFLYFRHHIELVPDEVDPPSPGQQVALVSRILEHLWARGIPAVAACDYEERLPNKGGYNNAALPWPRGQGS